MAKRPETYPQTASQTAGPYVHIGLAPSSAGFEIYERDVSSTIFDDRILGERITIQGVVYDGNDDPLTDVLLEVWQANDQGDYAAGSNGWGRVIPDPETGLWRFETIKPAAVADHDGRLMAPHISVWLVARGINVGLWTRLYFDDEPALNAADPVLAMLEEDRKATLISTRQNDAYQFDIRLQGSKETVFFDI